ncbi:regulatory protein, luxR family [Actinokineospora alba]|uniref:Regulatory protein, luxR family n=1 Tax=Actinokineospora alba TaxID=504798 RepID=A0A1H0S4K4_9PSEU|nr:LuxR family transcriptional regulator [Actinokineospora alba]TDP66785.1 regulatory LuxR family protein [Actinokineospora alba]SDI49733.1 regulatory protein, luxR family [Actinokineospora alba]SDP36188.1 regulatory protein, luxR family [Actinokineospora alba]
MAGADSAPSPAALVAAGESALSQGAWERARASFEAALAAETSPEGLDGLARALWWLDRPADAIEARVRAYALFRRAGDVARAVRIALWLAHEYSVVHGNEPAAEGWLARAEHLLADQGNAPERGYLDLAKAERCLDPALAAGHAATALTLARELADSDLELAALSRIGLAKITLGEVDEGLRHLDQAMAAATGEEAATFEAVARTCCSLVLACDIAGDDDRVREWGKVMEGYVHRHNELPLLNFCPTCAADLLSPDESEAELVHALADLADTGRRSRCVDPAVRLSQLRLAQGRIEEAEEALVGYGGSPTAVRADAAIRLARGEPAAAVALLDRQLSLISRSGLLAVPLLAQLVEAQLADGDAEGARTTAEELMGLAQAGTDRVTAIATVAAGRVALATAAPDSVDLLERGAELFGRLRMPYEEARARLELATALRSRNGVLAVVQARSALKGFERLGARHEADRAAAMLRDLGVRGRTGPKDLGLLTEREQEVLRLLARGLTNREIGARLFLSAKTVEHHVGAVLRKLGVKTRTEAAAALSRVEGGE